MRIRFTAVILCCALLATGQPHRFHSIINSYYEDYLQLHPTIASSLGDPRYNDQLENVISQPYRESANAMYQLYLDSLKYVKRNQLSERDQLSYDIFEYEMKRAIKRLSFPTYLDPVNQFGDFRLSFSQLGGGSGNHPFKTVKDYDDFLKRMHLFAAITDTAISNMRKGVQAGRVQPKIVMQKTLPQLRAMLTDTVEKSLFFTPVKNIPADFSDADKVRLTNAYRNTITTTVIPSYRKLLTYIENEYLPATREQVGLHAIPGGKEEYEFFITFYTTADMSPDEIYETGLKEVKRIRSEMEMVKHQAGFAGDMKAFFEYLAKDPKFFPFTTEQQAVDAYNAIHQRMKPFLAQQFNMVPRTLFEVRPVEKYRAASAAAHYMSGTIDGTRPGVFYFPILDPRRYHNWRMENLFLHEAIPGHHYQISLQLENTGIPSFQKISRYPAYVEGWGLYSEKLGSSLGLYKDPYQRIGQLYGEMHRAIRLVVDVAIHYKGWTREQAIQYSLDNEPVSEQTATQEIERYIAMPGQAVSYKTGELKILELRKKAEKKLGNKFDVRAFHDEVLKDGAMPLMIFERKIERWMKGK